MGSSSGSGTTSGSTRLTSSGSEEGPRHAMDQRKQRRMLSNRESARRSRMRKQKHLDDLTAQVAQLRRENNQILASSKMTTQQYLAMESENSILRTQIMELSNRLESLNDILQYMNGGGGGGGGGGCGGGGPPPQGAIDSLLMAPWSLLTVTQPIITSADMFLQY